jgi:Fic family protein
MNSFRDDRLVRLALPPGTVWLLSEIGEAKGRQDLFAKQTPQLLEALRETALIQSVESSNRIEGVVVRPDRLLPLVTADARPKDRSEEEIQGYRRALTLIHARAEKLEISSESFRRLHELCQRGAGDAGEWKRLDNDIVEFRPGQAPTVRFRTVPAKGVSSAVEELCRSYRHLLDIRVVHPLVITAGLILDLLCIHPFRDGNGRVSRLATLLALYHHGYGVGRFVSLERLVEETREDYYAVLKESSDRWHEGRHDLVPWLNYYLTVIRRAYRLFEERAGSLKAPRGAKTTLVAAAIDDFDREFSVADLERSCPGVSRDMVRRVVKDLARAGKIQCLGRGPGAKWRKKG